MHVEQLLKSDHSAPSGGRLNFGKYTDFCTSDFHLCGRRYHKNCPAEFIETWDNKYIGGVAAACCFAPSGGRSNFSKYTDFCTSDSSMRTKMHIILGIIYK